MKLLLLFILLFAFFSCEDKLPDGANEEFFGKCVSNEEAEALGFSKKCSEQKCLCLQDVHGEEFYKDAHCHSSPDKCD